MSNRLLKIQSNYYAWPIGSRKPTTFAISETLLPQFLEQNETYRIATEAEAAAAVEANQAGPLNRKLTEAEISSCYRDNFGYERFFAKEGVELKSFHVN